MYKLLRPFLFALPPEVAHHVSINALKYVPSGCFGAGNKLQQASCNIFGLAFPNRVGLAAGLDKNGEYIDALAKLGFGHIEIGTVTPKAQSGNPKPRLFRIKKHSAIINRMGFNNKGVDNLIQNVKKSNFKGILGINIGKNLTTEVANAIDDYQYCFDRVYDYASYITVNVSSPNTPGLRALQEGELMHSLFSSLKQCQQKLAQSKSNYVPMIAKLAPDLSDDALIETVSALSELDVDGFIFSNTTNTRPDSLVEKEIASEQGGLSGAPLFELSTGKLEIVTSYTDKPVIAVGGIQTKEHAKEKLNKGAKLVQLYTGLIFKGPELVKECLTTTA